MSYIKVLSVKPESREALIVWGPCNRTVNNYWYKVLKEYGRPLAIILTDEEVGYKFFPKIQQPLFDFTAEPVHHFTGAVYTLARRILSGEPTAVCCTGGIGRSRPLCSVLCL